MQIIVDGCTEEDIHDIVENMAPKARAAYDTAGLDPEQSLFEAFFMARMRSIVKVDDEGGMEVLAVFGIWNSGYFFLVWTPEFFGYARKALRRIRESVAAMVEDVGGLWIYIDKNYPADIKLAKWLGFRHVEEFDFHGTTYQTYARSA